MSEHGVLLTTLPGKEQAQSLARMLVEERLAAGVLHGLVDALAADELTPRVVLAPDSG